MAKKSFVISNDDGRVTFTNTSSISIDDGPSPATRGHIGASQIIVSEYKLSGIPSTPTGSFLSASAAGIFAKNTLTGSVHSGALGWNGTSIVATTSIPGDYSGSASTDVSGNYKQDVKVINIGNVSSGSLPVAYGGTGLSGSQYAMNSNLILKVSGSGSNAVISVLSSSASGTVLTSGEGRFNVQFPSYRPDVRYYNVPGVYTWTRPIGARFTRVILQGAGGGGGGGYQDPSTAFGGGGGASGGFTDIVIDVSNILTSIITVGTGGAGGAGATGISSTNGSTGGTTSWLDIYSQYTSSGGGGGLRGGNSNVRSTGGVGITKNGGGGAATNTNIAASVIGMPSGGGKGYGVNGSFPSPLSGGIIVPILFEPNKNFGYNTDTTGQTIITTLMSGGAGATLYNVNGQTGSLGSGGGGGGAGLLTGQFSNGGKGGDGYALIISW